MSYSQKFFLIFAACAGLAQTTICKEEIPTSVIEFGSKLAEKQKLVTDHKAILTKFDTFAQLFADIKSDTISLEIIKEQNLEYQEKCAQKATEEDKAATATFHEKLESAESILKENLQHAQNEYLRARGELDPLAETFQEKAHEITQEFEAQKISLRKKYAESKVVLNESEENRHKAYEDRITTIESRKVDIEKDYIKARATLATLLQEAEQAMFELRKTWQSLDIEERESETSAFHNDVVIGKEPKPLTRITYSEGSRAGFLKGSPAYERYFASRNGKLSEYSNVIVIDEKGNIALNKAALDQLPEEQRQALLFTYFELLVPTISEMKEVLQVQTKSTIIKTEQKDQESSNVIRIMTGYQRCLQGANRTTCTFTDMPEEIRNKAHKLRQAARLAEQKTATKQTALKKADEKAPQESTSEKTEA